ncbi:MAG: radical SAM protein, partial [Patescibacteria group bacterium]
MKRKIKYLFYAINYLLKTKILRKEIPFIGGIVINEKCNLHCKQCDVANRNIPDLSYEDIKKGLQIFYDKGIRSVFIEGGEPSLWRDGYYKLEDVVKVARKIGFYLVSIYTNGTFPINVSTDSVFVSIDGLKETTNDLRGNGINIYDRIIKNIKESSHPNIIINYTINSRNESEIEAFCKEISKIERIKGIFFYFHTPYFRFDELFLNLEKKRQIIKRILNLKKKGYKIFNSSACLKGVYKDNWIRPSKICYVYADNKLYQCCRALGNKDACKNCGYLGYSEIIYILKLKPSAIISALNYLPRK